MKAVTDAGMRHAKDCRTFTSRHKHLVAAAKGAAPIQYIQQHLLLLASKCVDGGEQWLPECNVFRTIDMWSRHSLQSQLL
jgi:hypothetical protein